MIYALYLSDIGYPPEDSKENWIICRTYEQAVEIVDRVAPGHIYFGADLQSVADCFDFVNWFVEYDKREDVITPKFTYDVENGDFSQDISRIMYRYLKSKWNL